MQFFHSSIPITLDLQYGFVPIFWLLSCILSRCDILSLIQKFQSYSIFQHLLLSVTQLSALRINWHTIMWMLFLVVFSDWCKSWFGIRWRKYALLRQLMQKRKVEVLHKCASVYFGRNMFCDSYIGIPEFPLGSEQCVFLVQTWPPVHTIRILKTLHIVLRPLPHTSPVSATMRRSSLHSLMWLFVSPRPATRGGAIGQLPTPLEIFTNVCVGMVHQQVTSFCPPKISVACGPGITCCDTFGLSGPTLTLQWPPS